MLGIVLATQRGCLVCCCSESVKGSYCHICISAIKVIGIYREVKIILIPRIRNQLPFMT